MEKPKLLAPAGDFISLRAAIDAGADEIYFGLKGLNMRAGAENFAIGSIRRVINICHKDKVKAFLAVNTIIFQNELKSVEKIIVRAKQCGIDAVICWDMSVTSLCQKYRIPIHLSTQASVSNFSALKSYKTKLPMLVRVILARECSLDDIKSIITLTKKHRTEVEIEAFIHGAMCVAVSGRCFMSQYLFNKSANRGECLQPCRRKYKVLLQDPEEHHELLLGEDFVMSPKDLCAMPFIDKLIDAGIRYFKIEGRNRSPEYASTVVSCYRKAIDFYAEHCHSTEFQRLKEQLVLKMRKVYNRDFSSGFFVGKPINEWCHSYGSKAAERKEYVGKVLNYYPKIHVAEIIIQSNPVKKGDAIMFQGPTTGIFEQPATQLQVDGRFVDSCPKGIRVGMKVSKKVRKNDRVYKIVGGMRIMKPYR